MLWQETLRPNPASSTCSRQQPHKHFGLYLKPDEVPLSFVFGSLRAPCMEVSLMADEKVLGQHFTNFLVGLGSRVLWKWLLMDQVVLWVYTESYGSWPRVCWGKADKSSQTTHLGHPLLHQCDIISNTHYTKFLTFCCMWEIQMADMLSTIHGQWASDCRLSNTNHLWQYSFPV